MSPLSFFCFFILNIYLKFGDKKKKKKKKKIGSSYVALACLEFVMLTKLTSNLQQSS
jgi:hypothetical protein